MINYSDIVAKEAYYAFFKKKKCVFKTKKHWTELSAKTRNAWRKLVSFVIYKNCNNSLYSEAYAAYLSYNKSWFAPSWTSLPVEDKKLWNNVINLIIKRKYEFDKQRLQC